MLRGCVPKKLMVYLSEYAEEFNSSKGYGWASNSVPELDWDHFISAKRKELQRLNGAYKRTLGNANVEMIEGRGRLLDANTVDVDGKKFTARNVLVAVGATPFKLSIPGVEHTITSDEALELPARPRKVTVLGAGYIAVEFAGIFARLGTEVHVVYRQPLPLRGFDEEVRKFITQQFVTTGLQLHAESNPVEVKKQADGRLTVVVRSADGTLTELADNDAVLMATGRVPNTQGLGLEEAGVKLGKKGEVIVDEYSRSSVPSVWSIGDCTDRVQLTPVALMEGGALARTLVLGEPTKPDYWAIPSAVFAWPNMASVGYTEEQAAAQVRDVDVYSTSFRPMKNVISGSELRTFMKVLVDAHTDKLVGIHMVGEDAAEILQGFAVAVKAGVTKAQLDGTVGIHPSAAEELVTLRSITRKLRDGVLVSR